MLFYTYLFVFWFVPCCALSYYLFLRFGQTRLAVISLIGWSLFFYGWWNPRFLWILVGSICVNFFLSQLLLLARERRPGVATAVLIAGILGNIGLLVHYKYWCLWGGTVSCQSVVLPLAISFFTFQQIEFLIDTWNGKIGAQNFVSYCLFVTFFPHLIAGPITRHSEMMPQFERPPSRIDPPLPEPQQQHWGSHTRCRPPKRCYPNSTLVRPWSASGRWCDGNS